MVWQPGGQVSLAGLHVCNIDLVALEQVGDDGQVAGTGELVSEQLGIGEDAKDVGQEEDGFSGVLVVFGVGEVSVDWLW